MPTAHENDRKTLDFIVIGAAKSGTTGLFELTKDHPELAMPQYKEAPFFSVDHEYGKGLGWYLDTYFDDASSEAKWGTITPQYMRGKGDTDVDRVAERIKRDLPDVKLVAILRHPIKRAFSQYKMMRRRGLVSQDFPTAVDNILSDPDIDTRRKRGFADDDAFLLGGEYGRLLESYYERFPAEQILVLYAEDLRHEPEKVLDKFFGFIGVDTEYRPENLGGEFHVGGFEPKVKLLSPGLIYKIPFVKKIWKNYVPHTFRVKIEQPLNSWNTKPDRQTITEDDPTYQRLLTHYARDVQMLEELTGNATPWKDWS